MVCKLAQEKYLKKKKEIDKMKREFKYWDLSICPHCGKDAEYVAGKYFCTHCKKSSLDG